MPSVNFKSDVDQASQYGKWLYLRSENKIKHKRKAKNLTSIKSDLVNEAKVKQYETWSVWAQSSAILGSV